MSGLKRILAAGVAAVGFAASATYVLAQPGAGEAVGTDLSTQAENMFTRDRNIAVMQRQREGYQARGLRSGSFLVFPKLATTAESNDNIYSRQTDKVNDVIWRVVPEVAFSSQFSRHAFNAYGRGTFNRYSDNATEDTDDYAFGASTRLDVRRFTALNGGVDFSRLTEPRSSPNSPGLALKPVRYDLSNVMFGGQHDFNRLRLAMRYSSAKFNYDDAPRFGGGVIDQDYRDRTVNTLLGRADYAVSPATAMFFELTGNKRDYRLPGSATEVSRESDGLQGMMGANFELGNVSRGEVAVGYLRQKFDDSRLNDVKGLAARARVEWFPSELTTVTFGASRDVQDSAVPGSGAMLSTNFNAQVDHELLRNLIVTGRAAYGEDTYKGLGRRDQRTAAGVSVTYLLNRGVGLTGSYSYDRTANVKGVGSNFISNKIAATLTLQY